MKNISDFITNNDDRYYGTIDLSSDLIIPDSIDQLCRFKGGGVATIELNPDSLDSDKSITIKTGVNTNNKANWNNAKSDGVEISETLTNGTILSITIWGNPWDYFYLEIPAGTGTIEYTINSN